MADKDKKRKREAREERPHKRVALSNTIRVRHLPKESIGQGPVIGKTLFQLNSNDRSLNLEYLD